MLLVQVLNMSITAGFCILAVLLARLLLRRMPKKYSYMLWLVVAFRLCCPVSLNSPLSLLGLGIFDQEAAEGHTMAYFDKDAGQQPDSQSGAGLAGVGSQENGHISYQGKPESVEEPSLYVPSPGVENADGNMSSAQAWGKAFTLLWLSGMGVMLLSGMGSYLLLRRRLSYSVLFEDNIYQSDAIISPFVLGFWRPRIYIPFGMDEGTLKLVLAHERFHLRRRDHWVKLGAYLLLAVHWFNPLCWLAFLLMGRDMEMSCDEHVLSELQYSRKPYCNALLAFATGGHNWDPSPLAFGEGGAKGRIRNALKWKNPKVWVKATAVVLCLATIITCALNPQAVTSQPGQDEADFRGEPATLYKGEGYSIYVPEGSWTMFAPNSWYAAEDKKIRFWVGNYAGLNKEQVEGILINQGYQADEIGLWKQEDDTLYRIQCVETQEDVWTLNSVISPYEVQENWEEALQEIFATFKVDEGYDVYSATPKAVMLEGSKLQLTETTYADETSRAWDLQDPEYTGSYIYNELIISNVTDQAFDFAVIRRNYETDESEAIIPQGTAYFNEDGVSATFTGGDYTLVFDFSDDTNPLPVVCTIKLWGAESLEGIRFTSNDIPGYEAG